MVARRRDRRGPADVVRGDLALADLAGARPAPTRARHGGGAQAMNTRPLLLHVREWLRARPPLLTLAYVLLGTWAIGIAVAAWQLDDWRQDLSRTLLQLNADARFR